jgi:hypothetical protein
MRQAFEQYFRSLDMHDNFRLSGRLSEDEGFFSFGKDAVCFGRSATGFRARKPSDPLYDVARDSRVQGDDVEIAFDPDQVIKNLRYEHYANALPARSRGFSRGLIRSAYYVARPLLPVKVRKHLQKFHLNGWRNLAFPKWPVDTTVDTLHEELLALAIRSRGGEAVPFVWFWPEGANACAVMTHDVETELGVQLSDYIMDTDQAFEIPASFQIVPEERYNVTEAYLNGLRQRGFEINIQGLNHDGHLFSTKEGFKAKVAKINRYGRDYKALGFRSPILYRNQDWYEFFDFDYDTSVPNVGHLDPQRGGCCTVMPYFVGNLVELPVTLTQDYSLFHILNDYSLTLWEQQVDLILNKHGLINAIVHPDYLIGARERETFQGLLALYSRLRQHKNVWIALPKDVSSWWRRRSKMQPVYRDGHWEIEGPGCEQARPAFASLDGDRLVYSIVLPGGDISRVSSQREHASAM